MHSQLGPLWMQKDGSDSHGANHEDDRYPYLVSPRQLQSPYHGKWQDEYQQIRYKVQRAVTVVGLEREDAVTWDFGLPVFGDGLAAEYLSPEIAEQVAERDEHDSPSAVSKTSIDVEDPQVQKEYRHLVAEETGQVRAGRYEDPLLVLLSEVSGEVPGVEAHSIAGRDA